MFACVFGDDCEKIARLIGDDSDEYDFFSQMAERQPFRKQIVRRKGGSVGLTEQERGCGVPLTYRRLNDERTAGERALA